MYIEHVCFNLALAILVTLLADQKNAGWYTAVILVSGCIPDIDGIFSLIQSPPVFTGGIIPGMAFHLRYFHSIGILCIYAVVVAGLLAYYHRLDFRIIALFAGTGFGAHLLEDATSVQSRFCNILAFILTGSRDWNLSFVFEGFP